MGKVVVMFEDRVRFNWGFHDGTAEALRYGVEGVRDMKDHYDAVYAAGYEAGVKDLAVNGKRSELSDLAWFNYNAALAA